MSNNKNRLKDLFGINFDPSTCVCSPIRSIAIIGENRDVDNISIPETLWDYANTQALYDFPTTAGTASIVSSDANDTICCGTGARKVLIEGLDANYNEISETVNLTGTCAVTTCNSYLRINFFRVVLSGSGQTNAGDITATVDCKVAGYIEADESLDHTAVFTVPACHSFFIQQTIFSNIKASAAIFTTVQELRYDSSTNTIIKTASVVIDGGPTSVVQNGFAFPRVDEKTDIWYNITSTSTLNVNIFGYVRGLLVHKDWVPKLVR